MKTNLTSASVLFLTLFSLSACYFKKGEGDPLISLRSRKARVVGEWNMDLWKRVRSGENNSVNSGNSSKNTTEREYKIENGIISYTYSFIDSDPVYTYNYGFSGPVSAKQTFNEDGTFERTVSYQNANYSSSNSDGNSESGIYSYSEKITGTWNFLGGVQEDYKNMERIILNYNKVQSTESKKMTGGTLYEWNEEYNYADGENSEILQITSLRNKEMKFTGTADYSDSYDEIQDGVKMYSGSNLNKSTLTGTFTQK